MEKALISLPEKKLVGIKVRTSNADEFNLTTAKIPSCIQKYYNEQLFEKIPNRKNRGVTYSAYTEYESDANGRYTYFFAEEVTSFDNVPSDLAMLVVPAQLYVKFTTNSGPMPGVVIEAWQSIWKMSEKDLGGKRNFNTDLEIYDLRAADYQSAVVDILIGIKE